MKLGELVLIRHGQSTYNLENRFTGWKDVPLTELGKKEAFEAAEILKETIKKLLRTNPSISFRKVLIRFFASQH